MMKNDLNLLFEQWRQGEPGAWQKLKPELQQALRRAKPALNFPPEHMATIRGLLCLRLEMADEKEMRLLPGDRFWEFYASLTRRYLVELLREGVTAKRGNPVPPRKQAAISAS